MLVVTPNLCLDVTVSLGELVPGTIMRASSTVTTAGGKGVNVVRAARTVGGSRIRLAGFVPGHDGQTLVDLLDEEGIELLAVPADGPVRIASILLEESGRASVINGRGPEITGAQWQQLLDVVQDALIPGETLICSGSLPPGVPEDGYAQLVRLARQAGGYALVDAAPAPLKAALAEQPDLVSPNLAEAEGLFLGIDVEPVDESGPVIPPRALHAAKSLHDLGARIAVVTAGRMGAGLCSEAGCWWLDAPSVHVRSPIGAGDSFIGAAAVAMESGAPDIEIALQGIAVASASCESLSAGCLDYRRAVELAALLTVEEL